MKTHKIPLRTCAITREKMPKKDLLRIVRTPEGNVVVDETGRQNGRGVYITKSIEVLEKAKKQGSLQKSLEVEIPDTIYEEIKNIIEK